MDKKYITPTLEVIELDSEDIVTNSTPWLRSGGADPTYGIDGDKQDLHWSDARS